MNSLYEDLNVAADALEAAGKLELATQLRKHRRVHVIQITHAPASLAEPTDRLLALDNFGRIWVRNMNDDGWTSACSPHHDYHSDAAGLPWPEDLA